MMMFKFEIYYVTGEFETGYTEAETTADALENIVYEDELGEIAYVKFEYTTKHTAIFEKSDIERIIK